MKSTLLPRFEGIHLAMIMDGNGRWARRRGWPRSKGHRRGSRTVRTVVRSAPELGIGVLTLYAFSSDNWGRPRGEVDGLMTLLERYLRDELGRCVDNGVRVNVVGRRDRLEAGLLEAVQAAEERTAACRRLHLRLAVDYSSRELLTRAARLFSLRERGGQGYFSSCLNRVMHSDPAAPAVDLLIRTSGEKRLSDFLLWECAYAELVFTETLWPDFGAAQLRQAVEEFRSRRRRFGLVEASPAGKRRAS